MSENPTDYVHAADAGRWDGDRFVFDPPLVRLDDDGQPCTIQELDCARMSLPDGITRDDVVHALLNPVDADSAPGDPR